MTPPTKPSTRAQQTPISMPRDVKLNPMYKEARIPKIGIPTPQTNPRKDKNNKDNAHKTAKAAPKEQGFRYEQVPSRLDLKQHPM